MRSVVKFGGSSVADIEKMRTIARYLRNRSISGEELVVVVSAMGKTTNALLSMAREAAQNPSKREMDMMLSTGEQVSIALLTMILEAEGQEAVSLTGYQAGILTEGLHTRNKIKDIDIGVIEKHLSQGKVVVVAGFQGYNREGEITTLGRGGNERNGFSRGQGHGTKVCGYCPSLWRQALCGKLFRRKARNSDTRRRE